MTRVNLPSFESLQTEGISLQFMHSLKLMLTILKAPNSGTDSQSSPILGLSKLVKQLQVPEPISGLPHCAYLLSVHGTQNQV